VAGGALALAMMLKPTVLGVLPLLAAGRRWRWLLATAAGLCALGLANVAASGWALTARYALEVVPRVALYGEGGTEDMMLGEAVLDAAGGDVRGEGNARIDGREYREQIGDVLRNASIPRLLAGDGPASRWVCLIVYLALVGVLAAGARRHPEDPAWYWGGLVAAVVAAPVGWAMSLPWALPLLADGRGGTGAGVRRGLTAVWLGAGVLGLVAPVFWAAAGLGAIAFAAAATLPRRATP
jgi:hypothetical protein